MPFDMLPVDPDIDQLARMELLGKIAAESHGSQKCYTSCLWQDLRTDKRTAALVAPFDQGPGNAPGAGVENLFGIPRAIFGAAPIQEKRDFIADAIKDLKAKMRIKQIYKQKELA